MQVKLLKNRLTFFSYLLSLSSLLIIFHPYNLLAASGTSSLDSTLTPYHGTAFDLEHKTPAFNEVNCENYHNGKLVCIKTTFSGHDGKPQDVETLKRSVNAFNTESKFKIDILV